MKSSDVPHLVPESKKPAVPIKAEPARVPVPVPAAVLMPAGESTNPHVQRLLFLRQAYSDTGNEAGLAVVAERLAELGCR